MELKKISDLFWKVSPNAFFSSIILAVVTGFFYSLLIPFIMYAINTNVEMENSLDAKGFGFFQSPTSNMAKLFLLTCICSIIVKSISQLMAAYIASKASMEHRLSLYHRINALPYARLESIGQARIINLINIDVSTVTDAATRLPLLWVAGVTILGTLGYLIYIDIRIFGFVFGCLIFGIFTYQLPMAIGSKYYSRARELHDRIQSGCKGLIFGAKELKLNEKKKLSFFNEELKEPEMSLLRNDLKGMAVVTLVGNYGEMIALLVIGVVVFHLPYIFYINKSDQFSIAMALLYLTGPVGTILSNMSAFQNAKISLNKLINFYGELSEESKEGSLKIAPNWSSISLENVSFKYEGGGFSINSISAEFKKGEVTFIVGGNGSGKSTLAKLLSLHYHPSSGEIFFGNQILCNKNLEDAREQISSIYTDFYLFPKIYENYDQTEIDEYLRYLDLTDKVKIVNGVFSTTNLSDGQRKRLALLTLLIEDRPIYIFDEWAADQDPQFKKMFYYSVLPSLRDKEKVIIVISHDDRYFDSADKLITMEHGTIREVRTIKP